MRKLLGFIIACLAILGAGAQQSKILGRVSLFNSKTETGTRIYIANAQVEDEKGRATPVVTSEDGKFSLIFVGIKEKSTVQISVRKHPLQVVNTDDLIAIAGQDDMVSISMAMPEKIAEYRRKIYNIGVTQTEIARERIVRQKNNELAILRRDASQHSEQIQQLLGELKLLKDKNRIEVQAQELAKKYSLINLDDASPLFSRAFQLFQTGYLDSALSELAKANLALSVEMIVYEQGRINENRRIVSDALELKADLHIARYETDSAVLCYQLLIHLDSTNPQSLEKYARFLASVNRNDESIRNYDHALRLLQQLNNSNPSLNESKSALVYNALGVLYRRKGQFEMAEQSFLSALTIQRKLVGLDSVLYESDLATTLNNLGGFYQRMRRYVESEKAYKEALFINQQLAKNKPNIYNKGVAMVLNNLGAMYVELPDTCKARSTLMQALTRRRVLASDSTLQNLSDLSTTLVNLGTYFTGLQQYATAELYYIEGCQVYKLLAGKNPEAFSPGLALAEYNLSAFYGMNKDFQKAEKAASSALEIYLRLSNKDPDTYAADIADTKNVLANIHSDVNPLLAKSEYLEALAIYQRLCEYYPTVFGPSMVLVQYNLGRILFTLRDPEGAELQLLSAFTNSEKEWIKNKGKFRFMAPVTRTLLGFYQQVNDSLGARYFGSGYHQNFKSIEYKLVQLASQDKVIAQALGVYYGNSSWHLILDQRFEEGEQAALRAISVDSSEVWFKVNLAHAWLFQSKYNEAVKLYLDIRESKFRDGRLLKEVCLADLNEFRKRGIEHPDMNKVRELLSQ